MPEVAETALTAETLHYYLRNKTLQKIVFVSGRYVKQKASGFSEFSRALPLTLKKVDSKGKFIWFELVDNNKKYWYILNTLGMTGMWSLSEPPRPRIILLFNDNINAYYMDDRNFGTLMFTSDKVVLDTKLNKLAPDFLKEEQVDLTPILTSTRSIYELLMNQEKIGSGLGNYLVSEILYRAKISPHRPGNQITKAELKRLDYWIKDIVKLSYVDNHSKYMAALSERAKNVKKKNYHSSINPKEKTLRFKAYRQKVDPSGHEVKVDKLANRSVYWVPAIQK